MEEFYNFVVDDTELKWFFDNIIEPPLDDEGYLTCISGRSKNLTDEERVIYKLGRSEMLRKEVIHRTNKEWTYNVFKPYFYRLNCQKDGLLTYSGLPYPEKSLVVYSYVNPSSFSRSVADTLEFVAEIQSDMINSLKNFSQGGLKDCLYKYGKVLGHLKSCHAVNVSRVIWRDFDTDVNFSAIDENMSRGDKERVKSKIYGIFHLYFLQKFGKKNFAFISTNGGFHILVRKDSIKFNPNIIYEELKNEKIKVNFQYDKEYSIKDIIKEMKFTDKGSMFVPTPGTLQYGKHKVWIINKNDFED